MNIHLPFLARQRLLALALPAVLLCVHAVSIAGPGAHGPNGEHLDGPTTVRAVAALPRVEAQTEAFELVAELRASELSILVDRYASNEPVLGARLDVESGAFKAVAAFRAEQGDYVATDAALLKALAAPGEHGLVGVYPGPIDRLERVRVGLAFPPAGMPALKPMSTPTFTR